MTKWWWSMTMFRPTECELFCCLMWLERQNICLTISMIWCWPFISDVFKNVMTCLLLTKTRVSDCWRLNLLLFYADMANFVLHLYEYCLNHMNTFNLCKHQRSVMTVKITCFSFCLLFLSWPLVVIQNFVWKKQSWKRMHKTIECVHKISWPPWILRVLPCISVCVSIQLPAMNELKINNSNTSAWSMLEIRHIDLGSSILQTCQKKNLQMRKNEASKLLHKLMGGRTARQVVRRAIYRARVFWLCFL